MWSNIRPGWRFSFLSHRYASYTLPFKVAQALMALSHSLALGRFRATLWQRADDTVSSSRQLAVVSRRWWYDRRTTVVTNRTRRPHVDSIVIQSPPPSCIHRLRSIHGLRSAADSTIGGPISDLRVSLLVLTDFFFNFSLHKKSKAIA